MPLKILMSVLALVVKRGMLGAAYYEDSQLHIIGSIAYSDSCLDARNSDSLVLTQSLPETVIVSCRIEDNILKLLQDQNFVLEQRPSSEFRFATAKQDILNLENSQFETQQSMLTYLQPDANFNSICCAGCVITYLSRSQLTVDITRIVLDHLNTSMYIPKDTYWSLSIFEKVQHPNIQSTQVVEGMSLFGILDKTKSKPGSKLLRKWFYNPLQSIEEIKSRHKVIELLDTQVREEVQSHIKNVGNITVFFTNENLIHRVTVSNTPNDWQHLCDFATSITRIIQLVTKLPHPFFLNFDDESLRIIEYVRNEIITTVNFSESKTEGRLVVNPHISSDLDELKRVYAGLNDFLGQLAERIVLPPNTATEFSLVYFPQLGFLIAIPQPPELEIPTLEFQFVAEDCAYYKSDAMRDLDLEIGDVHSTICDIELEIVQRVRDSLLQHKEVLLKIGSMVYELDCFCSLAESAIMYRYSKPGMVEAGQPIVMDDARHPMLELLVDQYVPNSVNLTHGMAITGPNASGKSVFMETIALVTFMAHLGSFVPASSATIPLTDKILSKLRTPSTITSQESSFCADLRQACVAVNESTFSSLVLLDEFGKGTIPSDGIGIFVGLVKSILSKGAKLVFSTHYFEMFGLDLQTPNLDFYTFKIMAEDDIEFMYEVERGRCTKSLGILCAARAGMEDHVVERALNVSEAIQNFEPIPMLEHDDTKFRVSKAVVDMFLQANLDDGDLEMCLWREVRKIKKYF